MAKNTGKANGKASKGETSKPEAAEAPAVETSENKPLTAAERAAALRAELAALEAAEAAERAAEFERKSKANHERAIGLADSILSMVKEGKVENREQLVANLKELHGMVRGSSKRAGGSKRTGDKPARFSLTDGTTLTMKKRNAEAVVQGNMVEVVSGRAKFADASNPKMSGTLKAQQQLVADGYLDGETGEVLKPFKGSVSHTARMLLGSISANGFEHWSPTAA